MRKGGEERRKTGEGEKGEAGEEEEQRGLKMRSKWRRRREEGGKGMKDMYGKKERPPVEHERKRSGDEE